MAGWGARRQQVRSQRQQAQAQLTFKAAPNFEAPGDADKNNVYEVTVSVESGPEDGGKLRGSTNVKVMVTDTDEAGTVTLSKIQPRIGLAVKASLSDPDGNLSGITWEWWKAPATDATDRQLLSTTPSTPTAASTRVPALQKSKMPTQTPIHRFRRTFWMIRTHQCSVKPGPDSGCEIHRRAWRGEDCGHPIDESRGAGHPEQRSGVR